MGRLWNALQLIAMCMECTPVMCHDEGQITVVETDLGSWVVQGLEIQVEHPQLWQAIVMWQIRVRAKADETHESCR
jgi:hypothetical protein